MPLVEQVVLAVVVDKVVPLEQLVMLEVTPPLKVMLVALVVVLLRATVEEAVVVLVKLAQTQMALETMGMVVMVFQMITAQVQV